jgi:1-acyl-sn-glycerol-3-phosphate acyltransferase
VHTKQGFPDLDRVIVISNHQLYADWMYLWLLLYHFGKSDHFVIIMKQELSRIPFVSWVRYSALVDKLILGHAKLRLYISI